MALVCIFISYISIEMKEKHQHVAKEIEAHAAILYRVANKLLSQAHSYKILRKIFK